VWLSNHHVDVVGQQMPFLNPALLLLGKRAKNLAANACATFVQHLPAALRDKNNSGLRLHFEGLSYHTRHRIRLVRVIGRAHVDEFPG